MAGEKNKFTTQEKLWKLDDTQLSTPKHDEISVGRTYLITGDMGFKAAFESQGIKVIEYGGI